MRTFKPNTGRKKKKRVFNFKPQYYGQTDGDRGWKKKKGFMSYEEYQKKFPPPS